MTGSLQEKRFICDRMAGTLCRYLRLMGYDTLDANDLPEGNRREDTLLLKTAREEGRIVLTRDSEFSRRDNQFVRFLNSELLEDQMRQLVSEDLIIPKLRLSRCSVCNTLLQPIPYDTLSTKKGAIPHIISELSPRNDLISWCLRCNKVYWKGSHTRNMQDRITKITHTTESETEIV